MKREEIEKLLKESGVAEDKLKSIVDTVMSKNGDDIEAEKSKTTAKDGELVKANETIKTLQGDIKKFDGVDIESLKTKATDLQTKYDTDIAAEKKKATDLQKTFALKESLKTKGVTDPEYLIYKHGGLDKFAFGEDGNPIGIDDTLKTYKDSSPTLFADPKAKEDEEDTIFKTTGDEHGAPAGNDKPLAFNFTGVRPKAKE